MPTASATANRAQPASGAMAVVAPAIGWFIPGAGHFLQKRWGRGLLLMAAIVLMFALGLAMEGKLYSPNTGDILDMLGFVGDIGAGAMYIVSKTLEYGQGNIARATADYGTKYLICAGLLNIIAAVDAYHIAIGKKQ
ncbi:MAG TPA: DUF6677 family protein [Terriglobales bacterium]|nr:DUF6677 family protein [Terriglobales bacterium]